MSPLPHDDTGSGRPLVLLHAGVADRRMWAQHAGPFAAAGFRVIAPDLPGFGDAELAPGPEAPWLDVLALLDALDIEQVALAGNSFGAGVALRAAVVAPERVSALVLLSMLVPGVPISPELDAAWQAEGDAIERGDVDAAVAAVVDAWTLPGAPLELRTYIAEAQRRAYELQGTSDDYEQAPDPLEEHWHRVGELAIPALVTVGEFDKPDFREGFDLLAGALAHASRHVFAGAGHLAPLEQPEAFRDLVVGFLS